MFFLTLLMACRPSVHLKITQPAEVSINSAVTSIAVVDRVNNTYSSKAIAGFLEASQTADTVRFQIVDAQQIYENLAVPVNGPIPNEAMKNLCQKAKVKGALVLHRFRNDSDMDVDKSTEIITVDGKDREYAKYTVTYRSELQGDWRFRGCNGETYDSFSSSNADSWKAEGDTPGDAKSNLGDPKDLDIELADELGLQYFKRVAPYEEYVWRKPYAGPVGPRGKRFRAGVDHIKAERWKKARNIFENNLDGFTGKLKGKAYYNLAIIHERLNELDTMVEYAQKADSILQSRKSAGYLDIAKERRRAQKKLNNQMKKASQVNSQNNN